MGMAVPQALVGGWSPGPPQNLGHGSYSLFILNISYHLFSGYVSRHSSNDREA